MKLFIALSLGLLIVSSPSLAESVMIRDDNGSGATFLKVAYGPGYSLSDWTLTLPRENVFYRKPTCGYQFKSGTELGNDPDTGSYDYRYLMNQRDKHCFAQGSNWIPGTLLVGVARTRDPIINHEACVFRGVDVYGNGYLLTDRSGPIFVVGGEGMQSEVGKRAEQSASFSVLAIKMNLFRIPMIKKTWSLPYSANLNDLLESDISNADILNTKEVDVTVRKHFNCKLPNGKDESRFVESLPVKVKVERLNGLGGTSPGTPAEFFDVSEE